MEVFEGVLGCSVMFGGNGIGWQLLGLWDTRMGWLK